MAIKPLPPELLPPSEPEMKVGMQLTVPDRGTKAMADALEALGLKRIGVTTVSAIRAAGVSLAELGSVNIASGHALVTAQTLTSIMLHVANRYHEGADSGDAEQRAAADKLLYPVGYLADKQSRVLTVMDKIQSPDKGGAAAAKKARRSFMPGANVQTVQVINYNSPGESPPALPLK